MLGDLFWSFELLVWGSRGLGSLLPGCRWWHADRWVEAGEGWGAKPVNSRCDGQKQSHTCSPLRWHIDTLVIWFSTWKPCNINLAHQTATHKALHYFKHLFDWRAGKLESWPAGHNWEGDRGRKGEGRGVLWVVGCCLMFLVWLIDFRCGLFIVANMDNGVPIMRAVPISISRTAIK